jgi:hypothetical protein
MMRDILQVFNPNNNMIVAKSVTCGRVELELIKIISNQNRADCDYFFNGHRIETRNELKVLLKDHYNANLSDFNFHDYKIPLKLTLTDFEYAPEAITSFTQSLATLLNVYNEDTVKAFVQCFRMVENRYGWHNFSLEHFLEFWQIAEVNNIPNTAIGNKLRQWQAFKKQSNLAS